MSLAPPSFASISTYVHHLLTYRCIHLDRASNSTFTSPYVIRWDIYIFPFMVTRCMYVSQSSSLFVFPLPCESFQSDALDKLSGALAYLHTSGSYLR